MGTAPTPPDWASGEVATESKMDSISTAISFLRNPPRARLHRSTDQSIPNQTGTVLTWDSEDFDTVSGHSTSVNTSRYTAQYDGVYLMSINIPWLNNTSSSFKLEAYVRRSDGTDFTGNAIHKTGSDTSVVNSASELVEMTTGQYCEVTVWHNRGSSLSINSGFRSGATWDILWVSA